MSKKKHFHTDADAPGAPNMLAALVREEYTSIGS
jgi:hypothetical protein